MGNVRRVLGLGSWGLAVLALVLSCMSVRDCRASVILLEKVVADVGGTPITLQEVLMEASFAQGRPVTGTETDLVQRALQRLVEQDLILREIQDSSSFLVPVDEEKAIREALASSAGGERGLAMLRAVLQIEDSEFQKFIWSQAAVSEFVRSRFLPFVYVSPDEVRQFYATELAAALQGKPLPSFEEVEGQITKIIHERKVNQEFASWLERRKTELKVRILIR